MKVSQRYERMVRQTQAEARIPALSVAVHRADRPLWTFQVGEGVDASSQFRMGSITKTFTCVLVLQCRDEGLLDLDDQIARHLPVKAHGELTIGRMLSHLSGLQREPFGDVWDTMQAPDLEGLLTQLDRAEQVLRPGLRFHYSNLAIALLGHLVGRLRGGTWAEVLQDRILDPFGLSDTAVTPERPVTGYQVDAYSDYAHPEPPADFGAVGPAAQLWSTAADLARWGAFLADPREMDPNGTVLSASTVDEMRVPQVVTEDVLWARGVGLGLILHPQAGAERVVHVGHDGAMPGFLAAAYGRVGGAGTPRALGVASVGSSGTAGEICELPHDLLAAAVEHDPADIAPWVPGPPAPAQFRSVLGRWWGEGFEYVFSWRDGALHARAAEAAAKRPPAVFAPVDGASDVFRTVSGREAGELLRLTRDADGVVVRLHWATYRFTRGQETFDGYRF
ncbi:beta-lactamase family protein [Dactylosporangium vinaceum]|uniref:Serine hydrolase domain-containing protein n=1 Tax=Dactylosporangium vinaceum TaxID=53362 RepID=A0ABV5M7J4_9ACTN|nr:serine hydrolase domain-containing protein [Dactylosporangium vinaceum]UAB95413.1 beta-lactamase family protein [Dactylosporangium vinaceum]